MKARLATMMLTLAAVVAVAEPAASIAPVAPVLAGESEFVFVDRMPEIRGERRHRTAHDDAKSGQRVVQTLYAQDFEHAVIETYLYEVACLGELEERALRTYIVAIKYPPKKPSSFAVATLHDIFKEVYVVDLSGRTRLYEDVGGRSMLALTERFKPACMPV